VAIKESLSKETFKDLYRCMHFAKTLEIDDEWWNDMFPSEKVEAEEDVFKR